MKIERTESGLKWGCSEITALFDDDEKQWLTWGINTPKFAGNKGIQIYITKTGKVRIHDSRGEWSPPSCK